MLFIVSIWIFVKFGGQTTKNVQGILKIALETLKCVLMEPSLFGHVMGIFLGENHVLRFEFML